MSNFRLKTMFMHEYPFLTIKSKGVYLYIRYEDTKSSFQRLYDLKLKYDKKEKGFILVDSKIA